MSDNVEWLGISKPCSFDGDDSNTPSIRIGIDRSPEAKQWVSSFEQVSAEEFRAYINNYPHVLRTDVNGIYDPPMLEYHDFSIGEIVGAVTLWNGGSVEENRSKEFDYHLRKDRVK